MNTDNREVRKLIAFQISEIREMMREGDFQRDFFESLCDQFERNNYLSDKQRECLERMYERITR